MGPAVACGPPRLAIKYVDLIMKFFTFPYNGGFTRHRNPGVHPDSWVLFCMIGGFHDG